jgi:hypothetical protein
MNFETWLKDKNSSNRCTYFEGFLAVQKDLKPPLGLTTAQKHNCLSARQAASRGEVYLTQRRAGPNRFSYYATKALEVNSSRTWCYDPDDGEL